jgi:hypothetical protein
MAARSRGEGGKMRETKWLIIITLLILTFGACKKSEILAPEITIPAPYGNVAYITVGSTQILIELLCEGISCTESGKIIDYTFTLKKGSNTVLNISKADLDKYKMAEILCLFNVPGGKIGIGHWAPLGALYLTDVPELKTRPDSVELKVVIKTENGGQYEKNSAPGIINVVEE